MLFEYSTPTAWICASVGLALFSLIMLLCLLKRKVSLPRLIPAVLLPALTGLLFSRGCYALLQPDQSLALLRQCYTTGFAGMVLGIALAARVSGLAVMPLLDDTAPWLCLTMVFARFAQRWLGETGVGSSLEEGMLFNRPPFIMTDDWGEAMLAVFVPEALCALIALVIVLLLRKSSRVLPGAALSRTVFWLLIPQLMLEQFREGHYLRWRMLRLEQVIIAVLVLAVLIVLCRRFQSLSRASAAAWWPVPVFLLLVGVVAVMEFVMDGKLFELPEAAIWALYSASVAGMLVLSEYSLRRLIRAVRGGHGA